MDAEALTHTMAKLPTAYNLGTAQPQPQSNIPNYSGQQQALQQFSQATETQAQNQAQALDPFLGVAKQALSVQQGIQSRDDAIELARSMGAYRQSMDNELVRAAQEGDLTDKEQWQKSVDLAKSNSDQTLQNFKGSPNAQAMLAQMLQGQQDSYIRSLSGMRVQSQANLINSSISAQNDDLASRAYQAPGAVFSLLNEGTKKIQAQSYALTPEEEQQHVLQMQRNVSMMAITGMLDAAESAAGTPQGLGAVKQAQQLMDALPSEYLSPEMRARFHKRMLEDTRAAAPAEFVQGEGGVIFNKLTGQQVLPGKDVQDYHLALKQAGKPTTETTVDLRSRGAFAEATGKNLAEQITAARDEAAGAQDLAARAARVDQLLQGVPTGSIPAKLQMDISEALGIDRSRVAQRQAAEIETGKMVLDNVARMKGNLSDKDREFSQKMTMGAMQTPEGRQQALYILNRGAQFSNDKADLADYVQQQVASGTWDEATGDVNFRRGVRILNQRYAQTFSPPTSAAPAQTTAPAPSAETPAAAPSAPEASPAPSGKVTKRWKFDAEGNLVPE